MPLARLSWLGLLLIFVPAVHAAAAELPDYEPAPGLAGSLASTGSDTLAGLVALWAGAFTRHHPAVTVGVQASGSATAPPALVEGTADLGPMSRLMKDSEIAAFETRFGYPPTALPVAIDAVAVFVHRDNPLAAMSLRALDAVFSATRRCGRARPVQRWGELGLTGSWSRRRLVAYGRNSASGTYGYFRSEVLCNGDFHTRVNELPGSASVVQAVAASLGAIGYSSLGYRSAGVRPLAIAADGGRPVAPSRIAAADGSYPLARFLYTYVNLPPGRPLPAIEAAFLAFVYSREGQRLVLREGYVPLPPAVVRRQRAVLGL